MFFSKKPLRLYFLFEIIFSTKFVFPWLKIYQKCPWSFWRVIFLLSFLLARNYFPALLARRKQIEMQKKNLKEFKCKSLLPFNMHRCLATIVKHSQLGKLGCYT